ncbi:unnamed protein product [Ranitomeya imitator]|uniref:Uncharacterized protein n=1 Tax=Ranitomeya imitator TaxID=111125 RepID=A0ABN9M5R6_9NEOB|nr:unnamed protein product [Ranitomeya imitator]
MEEKFSTRGYPSQLLTSARHATPRNRVSTSRIPFVNTFHPYSKRVQASLHKHWNILSKSYPNIPEFQQPFLPCYRRPTNIRDKLIMRCWHDTPEHDYGIVLLGTSLVRITIPRLIYVTHLDP